MTTLTEIFETHDGYLSDKWQSYLTVYDQLFAGLRDKPIRLLEIGVQNGGSLQIWRKYFRNVKVIVGCDINPDIADLKPGKNIHLVVGDAAAPKTIASIMAISREFDVVIEDGSHRSEDIIASFKNYFPLIAPGGFYVAEDLECSYYFEKNGRVVLPSSSIEYFKRLVDAINYDHWIKHPRKRWLARLLTPLAMRRLERMPVEELHKQIRSLRFYNSMCIVEKANGEVGPGKRIVTGTEALVDDAVLHQRGIKRY